MTWNGVDCCPRVHCTKCIVQYNALWNSMKQNPPPPKKKKKKKKKNISKVSGLIVIETFTNTIFYQNLFHHNKLQLITYWKHFVIPLDVTRCQSLAADMASQQLAIISVHDLVKFRDHTCIVTEIRNQHSGPLITELSSDFEMDGAEETSTKTKTAGYRFVPMTSQELYDLASKRTSQATKGQMKWAVQVFKGTHVSMFMFTYWFRPQLGQGWGDRSGHTLSEIRRHSESAWSVNWLKFSELCKYTNLRYFCICRHAVSPVNHRRWRGKLEINLIRVVAMILRRCLSVFLVALSKSLQPPFCHRI